MPRRAFFQAGSLLVQVQRVSRGPLVVDRSLIVQRAAREVWANGTGIGRSVASTAVWIALQRGRLRIEHARVNVVAVPGDLVAVPMGHDYRLTVEPGADAEHIIVNATGEDVDAWWRILDRRAPLILPIRRRGEFERCLEAMLDHLTADGHADRGIARHYLAAALGLAAVDRLRTAEAPRTNRGDAHAERCHALIEQRALAVASFAEIAAALRLNQDYLARVYRARFATSPADHLRRRRMEHAAQRLEDPERRLAAIADELGFSDAFAFSKAFKTWAGLSPRRWRQQFAKRGPP